MLYKDITGKALGDVVSGKKTFEKKAFLKSSFMACDLCKKLEPFENLRQGSTQGLFL